MKTIILLTILSLVSCQNSDLKKSQSIFDPTKISNSHMSDILDTIKSITSRKIDNLSNTVVPSKFDFNEVVSNNVTKNFAAETAITQNTHISDILDTIPIYLQIYI